MPDCLVFGRDAFVGAAEEVTYGTAVSPRTHFARIRSCGIHRKVEKAGRPNLTSGSGSATRRAHAILSDDVEGPIVMEVAYEGLGIWFKHLMGTTGTTGPTGSIYVHTYSHTPTLPTGLTIERGIGRDANGDLKAEVFEGCKLNTGEFSWSAGDGVGLLTLNVIGETSSGIVAASTPTFTANDVSVEFYQSAGITFNAVTYVPLSVKVSVDNKLARRRRLGSKLTAEPHRSDFPTYKISAVIEMDSTTLATAYTADTQGDVVLTLNGTSLRVFKITGHNGYLTLTEFPSSTPGIVNVNVEWECEGDGTDHGMKITVENTQTTAIAA